MSSSNNKSSFKDAYAILSKHAKTLRNQDEPNIDDLLTIVTQSVNAYKVCQERIDAVEKALDKAFADPGMSDVPGLGSAKTGSHFSSTRTASFQEDDDDDIPF